LSTLPPEALGMTSGSGRLAGRRILVVGAGTQPGPDSEAPVGNGRAISVLSAREGADIACLDVVEEAARDAARLVEAEGRKAVVLTGDASDPVVVPSLVSGAIEGLGGLAGLVLNVGIGRGGSLAGTTAEDWDLTFAVNVRAHFLACQAALPAMPEGSSIVFISSVAGLKPGCPISRAM
jgi:NAD(P)-dependent dehydrogenase (short-subunit alcohol dehydrogenase family)